MHEGAPKQESVSEGGESALFDDLSRIAESVLKDKFPKYAKKFDEGAGGRVIDGLVNDALSQRGIREVFIFHRLSVQQQREILLNVIGEKGLESLFENLPQDLWNHYEKRLAGL